MGKCTKCGYIFDLPKIKETTPGKLVYCECRAVAVDITEDYLRIVGNTSAYEHIPVKQ